MTAELAVALPAVVLVLAACLGGLRLGVERLRLTEEATADARVVARGEVAPASTTRRTVRRSGDVVCVDLARSVPLLGLPVPLAASGCALRGVVP